MKTHTIPLLFLIYIILISGFVDILRSVNIFSISLSGILTIINPLLGLFIILFFVKNISQVVKYVYWFFLFILYMVISIIWYKGSENAFQNILAFLIFCFCVIIAFVVQKKSPAVYYTLTNLLIASTLLSAIFYLIVVLSKGLGSQYLISPRAWAIYSLIGSCLIISKLRTKFSGKMLFALIFILLVVTLSLSRMAFIVSLLLIPLSIISDLKVKNIATGLLIGVVIGVAAFILINNFEPLTARFFSGDTSFSIANFDINASGRTAIWRVTIESFYTSPIFGLGAGSANDLITSVFFNISHPHSDYLRILHDYGIVGFSLLFMGLFSNYFVLFKNWVLNKQKGLVIVPILSALLILSSFFVMMITDNTFVYPFFAGPLGILVGVALSEVDRLKMQQINQSKLITSSIKAAL